MTTIKIHTSEIPNDSILKKNESFYDYIDSFQSKLVDRGQNVNVVKIAKSFFSSGPRWVGMLFYIRNKIVGLFGLKTSSSEVNEQKGLDDFNFETGTRLGLFKVLDKTKNEIVLGENDKHLDFRISLFLEQGQESIDFKKIAISTTVKFNNWFGKLYFFLVKPVHKLIVPRILRGIIRDDET